MARYKINRMRWDSLIKKRHAIGNPKRMAFHKL